MDKSFEVVLQEVQEDRLFIAKYDRSLPIHKDKREKDFDPKGVLNVDPLRILYFIKKNFRIVDLFNRIDRDHSNRINREEIKVILKVGGSPSVDTPRVNHTVVRQCSATFTPPVNSAFASWRWW